MQICNTRGFVGPSQSRSTTTVIPCAVPLQPQPPVFVLYSLICGHQSPVLYFYNFVISRVLYTWNYTAQSLLRHSCFSLSIIPLRSIQVDVCIDTSLLSLLTRNSSYGLVNHSPVEEHLGCFQLLAVMNFPVWPLCAHTFSFRDKHPRALLAQ
jgi:hypothetical protein